MTKDEVLKGLQAGRTLCVDRKDAPLLPWLLAHPNIDNSGIIENEEQQYSYIRFWWRAAAERIRKEE